MNFEDDDAFLDVILSTVPRVRVNSINLTFNVLVDNQTAADLSDKH